MTQSVDIAARLTAARERFAITVAFEVKPEARDHFL